mmetsp:Transcript_11306/g.15211  ORF Transcript_11306/g.15211 Transcript_11306/m.15211 type:complete len:197 (-) Transcript_11306:105-695(-)
MQLRSNFLAALAVQALFANEALSFESIMRPFFPAMQEAMQKTGLGFDWANHEVHTDDGYILNLFRLLPAGVKRASDCADCFGQPVFLMHGMGANGSRWLNRINEDIDPLAIALAKRGYDVWLGNGRGNHMSSEHEHLNWIIDEEKYWDYSYPEMATNDLPAMLNTVYEETGRQKINYIGISLGTTQVLYALSHEKT